MRFVVKKKKKKEVENVGESFLPGNSYFFFFFSFWVMEFESAWVHEF